MLEMQEIQRRQGKVIKAIAKLAGGFQFSRSVKGKQNLDLLIHQPATDSDRCSAKVSL